MNPYAKGLSNAVLGQSAPTSAGKVSTHFNSPYMKAISQNLMTAIYGSPQDELTRQQIAASKLGMQKTQAEMDTSAAQATASAKLADMLGSQTSYDKDGLKPEARRALSALNIAAGGKFGDFFTQTGEFTRQTALAGQENEYKVTAAQTAADQEVLMANLNSALNIKEAGTQNDYTTQRDARLHGYGIEDMMRGASNDLYRDGINNAFAADQNDLNRKLERTQSFVNTVLDNQTNPRQVSSIGEIFGVPMGSDMTQSLSEIEPNVTGITPTDYVTLLEKSSDLLWMNLGLDKNNKDHKDAFESISAVLAAKLQQNPNNVNEILSQLQSQVKRDGDDIVFEPSAGYTIERLPN